MNLTLSSSALKIIAYVTMVVDHIGFVFFPGQALWRIIGRIAFPLFAFLIAEGYRHTKSLDAYMKRLLLFALISQIPLMLMYSAAGRSSLSLNIFFTLCAGLIAVALIDRTPLPLAVLSTLTLSALAEILHFDYGAYGVLLIVASYLTLSRGTWGYGALAGLMLLFPLTQKLVLQVFALMSVPLLFLYNGERGRDLLPRQFFYWFYPVHMLVLWGVWYVGSL